MSVLEFIASLIGSLAWPLVVVVVALLFRSKIIELLTPAIRRLKAGPFEVEWDRAISEAEVDLEQPGLSPIEASMRFSGSLAKELGGLARSMPTAAILEAAARVEGELGSMVLTALTARGVQMPPTPGLGGLARLGQQHDVITEETARAIEGIAVLRNMAAHGRATDTTAERALDYLHLADSVMYAISAQGGTGGRGGDATVGGKGVAIGGPGGGAGPGGVGGDGGGGGVHGDGLAIGGEGGEAGQNDRGGRGGRSGMEIAASSGAIPSPGLAAALRQGR